MPAHLHARHLQWLADSTARTAKEAIWQIPAPSLRSDKLGVRSDKLAVRSGKLGVRSDKLAVRSGKLGVRSGKLGVRSGKLGVRSGKLGVRSGKLVVRSDVTPARRPSAASRNPFLPPRTLRFMRTKPSLVAIPVQNRGQTSRPPEGTVRGEWFAPEIIEDWITARPQDFAKGVISCWKAWRRG